jgi:hypothetical protein
MKETIKKILKADTTIESTTDWGQKDETGNGDKSEEVIDAD